MLFPTHIPAENALCSLDISSDKTDQEITIEVMIFRMNEFKTLFVAHSLLRQQMPMQVIGIALAQIESQHVVVIHVKRVLHDVIDFLTLFHTLADAQNTDAVDTPGNDESNSRLSYHQYRGGIEYIYEEEGDI